MRRTFAILCLLAGFATAPLVPARAQQEATAQSQFVEAFLIVRKGEEDEKNGNLKGGLANYRTATNLLIRVKQTWPSWQTDIVEFRLKRTMEAIERIQGQMGGGGASVLPPIDAGGEKPLEPLPPDPASEIGLPPIETLPPVGKPTRTVKGSKVPPAPAVSTGDGIDMIRNRITQLETNLQNANDELVEERERNKQLERDLEAAATARKSAESAQKKAQDLADIYQKNMLEIKNSGEKNGTRAKAMEAQLAEANQKVAAMQTELAAANEREEQLAARAKALAAKAQEAGALPGKIKNLEGVIAEEKKKNDGLIAKVGTLTKERDEARSEITKLKELNKQTDKLIADNSSLMKKLGDAERQILTFKSDSVDKEQAIANLQKQVAESQKALAVSNEKSSTLTTEVADLQKKVGDYSKQIQQFKADKTASTEEQKRMTDENRLLQGIVMRVLQEDANRAQRKKMIQKEMDKLHIQSDVLLKQIGFLTQPVVTLRPEERKLFKKPELTVQDPNTLVAVLQSAAPETTPPPAPDQPPVETTPPPAEATPPPAETAPPPVEPKEEPKTEPKVTPKAEPQVEPKTKPKTEPKSAETVKLTTPPTKIDDLPKRDKEPTEMKTEPIKPDAGKNGNSHAVQTSAVPNLPDDVKPLAEQAKAAFDREKYPDAERLYDKALQLVPNNLYLLSNRGVVQFRSGKLKQAEDSFRKALAIAPEDSFCWCTLGIVYYSQGKYDEAVNALTKSLAINSRNATAHNYLGITAAQKGWMEAAQKELETALQLEPKYADAYFNLAVVMATKTPADKVEAKRCYDKAVELGAEADPAMEALVK